MTKSPYEGTRSLVLEARHCRFCYGGRNSSGAVGEPGPVPRPLRNRVGKAIQADDHKKRLLTITVAVRWRGLRYGRSHRRTAVLRADGPNRAGHGLRASQSDGPVLLDLPDGAPVHLVSLHRHRHSGLRPIAQGAARPDHGRHGAGMLGGDRRGGAGRARHSGRMLGRLGAAALHASPAAEAHRRAGALGHRLQSRPGVHQASHRVLPGAGHRLSLGLHLRGFEPGVPRDADGAFLCRHVHRAQRACRRAVDHLSVRGAGQAGSGRSSIHASPAPRSS